MLERFHPTQKGNTAPESSMQTAARPTAILGRSGSASYGDANLHLQLHRLELRRMQSIPLRVSQHARRRQDAGGGYYVTLHWRFYIQKRGSTRELR